MYGQCCSQPKLYDFEFNLVNLSANVSFLASTAAHPLMKRDFMQECRFQICKAASPVYVQTVLVQWYVCYGNVVEFGEMFIVVYTVQLQIIMLIIFEMWQRFRWLI